MSDIKKAKLIMYTDGGARPNPSPNTGYGIHAYIAYYDGKPNTILGKYTVTNQGYKLKTTIKNEKLIKKVIKETNTFPSDLEENKNIELMELGPVFDFYGYKTISNTNNQAELDGATQALLNISTIVKSLPDDVVVDDVLLLLDSTYVLIYFKKLLLGSLNMDDVSKNLLQIEKLSEAIDMVSNDYTISLGKVAAHDTDIGNNSADKLATMGTIINSKTPVHLKQSTMEFFKIEKGYWKDPNIDTDLFYFKQLFNFYPDEGVANRTYYGLNYKDISDMGKKVNNITYTILKLNEPDTLISEIIKIIRDKLDNDYYPYVILLDNLTNKHVLRDYLRYGTNYLEVVEDRNISIKTVTGISLAEILYPPGLSALVMDKFITLDTTLTNVIDDSSKVNNTLTIDITDKVYSKNSKDKTIILPDMKNDTYIIKVPYKHSDDFKATTIRVKPKLDLPSRNTLKRYERFNPKVTLVLSWYNNIVMYNTYLELDTGDIISSNNIYSNKVILKELQKRK